MLPAVPFGTYSFAASTRGVRGPRVSSSLETATLDKTSPEAKVTLELDRRELTVLVRDEAGRPISGAHIASSFLSSSEAIAAELSPGVYTIEPSMPGGRLWIRAPGHVPVCRVTPRESPLEIRMQPGRPTGIQLSRPVVGLLPGELHGLAGSDCAVPLSILDAVPVATEDGSTFTVLNYPASGPVVFVWRSTGAQQPLVPGPDGVVRIALPDR
ncbi:MAG TPA: hypothetical protein VMM93_08325 [Vicinamibacterales bacterium]|nr:hypothetical protein [Vicinamibacterales bacterium]